MFEDVRVELKIYRPMYERLKVLANRHSYGDSFEEFLVDCIRCRMLELEKKDREECWEFMKRNLIAAFHSAAAKHKMSVAQFIDMFFQKMLEATAKTA